jgi:hypothetical protein
MNFFLFSFVLICPRPITFLMVRPLTRYAALHPSVPHVILLCLMPDDFTCQGERESCTLIG